jgi:hypothetical protein
MLRTLSVLTLFLMALALVPSSEAGVHAAFVGSSGCSSGSCNYTWGGVHWGDIVDVPEIGVGTFKVNGGLTGTCTFVGPVSCPTAGAAGASVSQSYCSSEALEVESVAILTGANANDSMSSC